jgi:hypothetical protein
MNYVDFSPCSVDYLVNAGRLHVEKNYEQCRP